MLMYKIGIIILNFYIIICIIHLLKYVTSKKNRNLYKGKYTKKCKDGIIRKRKGDMIMKTEGGKYSALDVARYVINYSWELGQPISNLKLQKLLYFIQAEFLANTDTGACFGDEIEAWAFGPVIPSVYHEFKRYGSAIIPMIKDYLDFSNGIWEAKKVKYNEEVIDECDRDVIKNVIEDLKAYSATDLVDISHRQRPWKTVYQRYMNNVIPKKVIEDYFKQVN